jgi:hypothetical protein
MSSPRISCLVFSVPATSIPNSGIYGANSTDNQPPDRDPKRFDKNGPAMVPLPRDRVYVLIQICALPASDNCRTDVITIRFRGSPLYTRRYTELRPVCMGVNPYDDQFVCAAAAR